MRGARPTLLIASLVLATALSGCFLDEIDKSMAQYPGGGKKAEPEAAAKAEPADAGGSRTASAKGQRPRGAAWWKTATSLGSEESKVDAVACKLRSGVQFMAREDCLARGGATP